MTLRRKKRKGSKFLAARRLFYFSSGADGAPLPAGWSVLDQGSCGCCGECAVGSRQLLSLSNACTRARFFEPQLREPRPPKPRAGTSTASCCLERIHAATTFGRKVAAPLLWKPTIRKFEAQNAITFTVRERANRPEAPLGPFKALSAVNNNAGIGPIPWLPFVPHRPWLQHLSVHYPGSPCWRLTIVADIGSSRITQSQRALGRARQAQRKVGSTLGVGTIDDHTGL